MRVHVSMMISAIASQSVLARAEAVNGKRYPSTDRRSSRVELSLRLTWLTPLMHAPSHGEGSNGEAKT